MKSAADRRIERDEELVAELVGTSGVCGVCCTDFRTPALKVLHLAADRDEAIAELGGPVGVSRRNAARRVADRDTAVARAHGIAAARRAGYGLNAEAFADGYARDRRSPALEVPGPARLAHSAGWIQRQRDELEAAHAANVDGQHDELDNLDECPPCGRSLNAERTELVNVRAEALEAARHGIGHGLDELGAGFAWGDR